MSYCSMNIYLDVSTKKQCFIQVLVPDAQMIFFLVKEPLNGTVYLWDFVTILSPSTKIKIIL